MADGWSEPKAIGFIQTICDEVKGPVELQRGVNYVEFTGVQYRNQIVGAHENYLIKVHVGAKNYIHLKVSRDIVFPPVSTRVIVSKLLAVQYHKTREDPLEPFPPNLGTMADGWSEAKAIGFIQTICDEVKGPVELQRGVNYVEFTGVQYRNQIVGARENYLIKVHVGAKNYIHLKVSRDIVFPPVSTRVIVSKLFAVQYHKTREDPLEPFPPSGPVPEWSETKVATEETQEICHELKDQVVRETGANYQEFTAVEYRSQDLAGGVNYLIKVRIGGTDYDHLSVSQDIMSVDPFMLSQVLRGVEQHKTKEDPLRPFPPNLGTMADGWSEAKAIGFIQTICDEVKGPVELKTGVNYVAFTAVDYRFRIANACENYLIKVHVGGADYDHLLVAQEILPMPRFGVPPVFPPKLLGVQQHKTKEDPLEPFPPNVGPGADIILGGWSQTMDATEETKEICYEVKGQVEKKTGVNYKKFTAVEYRNQIVAGENFLIKVHVGGADYVQLSVFRALPCNGGQVVLLGVLQHKTREDPLKPFPPNVVTGADIFFGGWSGTMDATQEIQNICDEVKGQVEKKTGVNYKKFTAVEYRNQIVAGENFLIKVRVGGADYIQLSVFQELRCNGGKVVLRGVQ